MEPSNFIHLHVHTQYSLLDGAIRLDALFKRAKEYGMQHVAITDHGTMFGCIEFYEKAKKEGVNPVIGCEVYVAPRTIEDKTQSDSKKLAHLVLLAQNQEGYVNLCKLASIAQLKGFYYKPRVDKALLREHNKGLIALSACLQGEIPQYLIKQDIKGADAAVAEYVDIFGADNFFLEVQHNGIHEQEIVNQSLREMSERLSVPLVATNDCHYLDREDVRAHEVLLCIQTGKTMNDPKRFRFGTDQLYFKPPAEMMAYFKDYPGAIENTLAIAERCAVEFDFNTYHFPKFEANSGLSVNEIFDREVHKGFDQRMRLLKQRNPDIDEAVYRERLDYEMTIIKDMGFPGYFLIVADFIQYGKENGIPVGPGRGSAAGSIVAYAMRITDLDPIEHGLIFERFLNPARISMPDIDVDFCINGREKVYNYVVEKYGGGDYVAQIITFGKLKTRAVIRDVGRALDIPLREVDALAKMVPDVLNIRLNDALEQEPKIMELARNQPEIAELITICRTLEGLPRHASTHAAGVVVSDKPLYEYLPLYRGKKGEVVTQFDMKRVEQIGLVKFDFLGLRNLTVIEHTLQIIANQEGTPPDLINIDFEDPKTYELLARGDTTGVFQLESSGMKDLLVRLKPEAFSDVTALVALYRPGPLDSGMVDDYVERKHGRKPVEYLLPELEPILKETYGVILYQEQVMKIAGVLASYTMAEADGLRKAMGKKIAEMMVKHRELFMKGAKENNLDLDKAKQIFDLMEKFGGYGFNKSHSAAYALIAYQTAFLKAHYPVEFMAALLTSEMNSSDGVVKFINECKSHDITILPPDINESEIEFTVVGKKIRFGLVAVKNVGEAAIEAIIEARKDGNFVSLFEFCERVSLRKVNKRVIESLIKCGAFDSTGDHRAQMIASLEIALEYGARIQKEKDDPQMGLFDMEDSEPLNLNRPKLLDIPEWDEIDRLALEKESLGFYISGHPLDKYKLLIETYANANALSVLEVHNGRAIRIGGLIRSVKAIRTKKGDPMAFITIEDLQGTVEVVVFTRIYQEVTDLLIEDQAVIVQGEAQVEENSTKILAEKIVPIDKADETWTADINLKIDVTRTKTKTIHALKEILYKYPGACKAYAYLIHPDKWAAKIVLPEMLKLNSSPVLKREVNGLLGYDAVMYTCEPAKLAPKKNHRDNFRKRN